MRHSLPNPIPSPPPPRGAGAAVVLRPAVPADAAALAAFEERVFETDRLSRRSFQYILARGHARTILAELPAERGLPAIVAGYALVLLRRGTALARVYSLAIAPELRGEGVGRRLLAAAEAAAAEGGAVLVRLEVRADNAAALALYGRTGYRPVARLVGYYEDGGDGLRMEKLLRPGLLAAGAGLPYYAQSTEFTCGPAALMMAMHGLDARQPLDAATELTLWREVTTIFMTEGHGGADPFGLALAAVRRGFRARLHVGREPYLFLETVRSEEKRRVMRLVQDGYRAEAAALEIPVSHEPLDRAGLAAVLAEGGIPVVLVSLYRLIRLKAPHWIVVHGMDDRYVYAHDPWIEPEELATATDRRDLPIPLDEFDRMARFGRSRTRAAVVVLPRETGA